MWSLYLLSNSVTGYTYIGCTTDSYRRLRQHRRELVGGAKSTAKHCEAWSLVLILSGFNSKSEVMRWEKLIKSRCRGLQARRYGFQMVLFGECPMRPQDRKSYIPPTGLKLEIING